jgi:hypothetical protein
MSTFQKYNSLVLFLKFEPNNSLIGTYKIGLTSALSRKEEAAEQNRRKASQPLYKSQPARGSATIEESEKFNEDELSDQCPEPNGYFADAEQCDKYYDCRDGRMMEKLCPDGLVFNDFSPQHEKCDLPFGIDCSKRFKHRKLNNIYSPGERIVLS